MDNAKRQFATQVQSMATQLAAMSRLMEDLKDVYNARLYGPGAVNELTDAELATLEAIGGRAIKADEIYAFVILCDQMKAFLHNGTPAQSDYAATLNHIRTDI